MNSNEVLNASHHRTRAAKCPPAISGQRGHDRTFHVACVLVHGFDFPVEDALTVLRRW
jgi:hypothetical protein